MDAELPALIGTLPRTPYGVRELPESGAEEAPPAFYHRASGEGGRPGWLLVNTSHLSSRPRYEMVALALHETVPGHHVQIALQNEQKQMADFRRIAEFPAFIEGWALYAEKLGEEVGMYQREQDRFGRLSFEMLRAARLVVDTGIHDRGWSRSRACQYLLEKTALTEQNVNAEVDRYISVPGQALSYKMGERVLLRLREKAEHELESTFSRRAFHDQILEEGAMPLDMLEDKVNRWIKSRKPS